jgi:hypothetical protein
MGLWLFIARFIYVHLAKQANSVAYRLKLIAKSTTSITANDFSLSQVASC